MDIVYSSIDLIREFYTGLRGLQVHVLGLSAPDAHTLLDLSLSPPAGPVHHCCSIPVHAVARPLSVNCISSHYRAGMEGNGNLGLVTRLTRWHVDG